MKGFIGVLMLSIFVLSSALIVCAETSSGEPGTAGGASIVAPDGTVISTQEFVEPGNDIVESGTPTPSASSTTLESEYLVQCMANSEVYKEMTELEKEINEKFNRGEDVSELKSDMMALNVRLKEQKEICAGTARPVASAISTTKTAVANPAIALPTTTVAVGTTCELPSELKNTLETALKEYKAAIESKDSETTAELRAKISELENSARIQRERCMAETVPGLIRQGNKTCEIPEIKYRMLENNKYKISQMRKLNATIPEDLLNETNALESDIENYKARCNALKVSKDAEESDIAKYYRQRMVEAMDNEDVDSKMQSLKDLRKEIDETIKNLIEQKKRLNYSEVKDVAERIEFKARNVRMGDSETNGTEVEVEVDSKDGSPNVKIRPTKLTVLLTQEGYNVTADDITVNDSGIYVQGMLVKTLPAAVFEHNKNLEQNAERILELKLEKEGERAVYKAEYNVRKRILGIIPANAKHELVIDAEDGETLQDKKPWWSIMATTVDEVGEPVSVATNVTA
jgi:hypothetical protein